jgi:hypothetical protein
MKPLLKERHQRISIRLERYELPGVAEYWRVDPEPQIFQ